MENIVRLKGDNINLCTFRNDPEAVMAYTRWMNNEDINMWINKNDKVISYIEELNWVEKQSSDIRFNIVTKENNVLIGTCSIGTRRTCRNVSLGICIGETEYLNNGYGTEAIKMLIKFAFEELNVHRVELTVLAENERAIKCYTKAGFKICGTDHEIVFFKGHYCDLHHMEILEQDYFKK